MSKLLLARISEVLDYDPTTGLFTWKIHTHSRRGKIVPGTIAGTDDKQGRVQIKVAGKSYRAHRLAFLFMTGRMPPKGKDVDHINGVDSDNRWLNLRPAKRGQNNWNNHKVRANSKSGKTGVSWVTRLGKWLARVKVNGVAIDIGHFAKLKDAIKARQEAELKYFGEFAPK